MNSKIFVVQNDQSLTPLVEAPFESEDIFQSLLELYPDLLAGEQMNPSAPRRWLLVSREYGVPKAENDGDWWSLDHLFIDHEAIPTLVEVKRASDTRARREVVAQMLDYAANGVVYWPVERMRSRFESACASHDVEPTGVVAELLQTVPEDVDAVESFWSSVQTNLKAGRIRLVFVADQIHPELRRIIEFLNEQMSPAEVLGVEIKHFRGDGIRTLVPQVIGKTAQSEATKIVGGQLVPWTEDRFFAEAQSRGGRLVHDVCRAIYSWAHERGLLIFWGQGSNASFTPYAVDNGRKLWLMGPSANGRIYVRFDLLKNSPPFDNADLRDELRQRLNALGAQITLDRIGKQPPIDMNVVAEPQTLAAFLAVFEWVIDVWRTQLHREV